MKIIKLLTVVLFIPFYSLSTHAENEYKYVWDKDLDTLPKQQKEFVQDIVKALRTSNVKLGYSRLHTSVLSHPRCKAAWERKFTQSTIKEQYAVRIKPGKYPDTLYFSIRHQKTGEDGRRNFFNMKYVVYENNKLVINMNCDAVFEMADTMKNYKTWENDHKCGYKIRYNDGSSMRSSSGVISEKPVEGADLYVYCLQVCKDNVGLNDKNMKSYQCYINDIEIEKTKEMELWKKKTGA